MKFLIDTTELQLLLEKKRDYIGCDRFNGLDVIFAGITFIITTVFSEYKGFGIISGEYVKLFCVILGLAFSLWGLFKVRKSMKHQYDQKQLYEDIKQLNEITHPFSIVAIKDTFNAYPNRYLLYYDERWKCRFFFSFRTVENDEENIKKNLSNELKIESSSISVKLVTEEIYRKYSVSDQTNKVYDHKIYSADISMFSSHIKEKEFEIDGKKFYWMTINDMERDSDIREKNMDVVDIIKHSIG